MLSKVAARMYWFGRYVERTENIARLISVNTNLALDLPGISHIWGSLITITGLEEDFAKRYSVQNEKNVLSFLLTHHAGSLRNCIREARENARTTRELLPNEAWEKINDLHIYLEKNSHRGIRRNGRHALLKDIIKKCHELTGYLEGCMSNIGAYHFIKIGRNLERADMTTRILDAGCLNLLDPKLPEIQEHEYILWMHVLVSLAAYQMYRQNVLEGVSGEDVAVFLLKNRHFPRAVARCLREVMACCEALPNNVLAKRSVRRGQKAINSCHVPRLLEKARLHEFIDAVQLDLADIHDQVVTSWFGHAPDD